MNCFHCDNCGMMVFFENEHCVKCGEKLGFLPSSLQMSAQKKWAARGSSNGGSFRHCANRNLYEVCNWLVPNQDPNPFCLACRLNEVIPDLTVPGNRKRWYKLELAKRRCLYTFLQLGLPVDNGEAAARPPLRFRFLADIPNSPPVLTGHENGVITINIAEADEAERENRRIHLHEPYRTLVGHFRHESGHYYWDRLVANSPHLPRFRELFGDETADYKAAMQKYYQQSPPDDWATRTVTAYAASHPWEDWAETWAHYLHIMDMSETAENFGLVLTADKSKRGVRQKMSANPSPAHADFDRILNNWSPLACALNSINRGMGLHDLYPFVIPPAAVEKLRFIHDLIATSQDKSRLPVSLPDHGNQLQTTAS